MELNSLTNVLYDCIFFVAILFIFVEGYELIDLDLYGKKGFLLQENW